MLFVIHGLDRAGDGSAVRRANRAAHLAFAVENEALFRWGGALVDEEGGRIGSLMVVELADRAAVERFLAEEPYCRAGLFDPLRIDECRQVIPQPAPGSLAAELARERARED